MTKKYYVYKKEVKYRCHYIYRNEKQKIYDYYDYDNCNISEYLIETDWECLGYCENATEVFNYLLFRNVIDKYVDYILPLGLARNKNVDREIVDKYINTYYYFTDDKDNFKTLNKIKVNLKNSKKNGIVKQSFQVKYDKSNINEKRQSLTPQEISEIKDAYNIQLISIKSKRNFEVYRWRYCSRKSKSWKDQSKRKHQYKN